MERATLPEGLKGRDNVYELFSVMVHSGGALGGHYYAYVKHFADGAWYKFDDSVVSRATLEEVESTYGSKGSSKNAYMIMYRKVVPESERPSTDVAIPEQLTKALQQAAEEARAKRNAASVDDDVSVFDENVVNLTVVTWVAKGSEEGGDAEVVEVEKSLKVNKQASLRDAKLLMLSAFEKEVGGVEEGRARLRGFDKRTKELLTIYGPEERPLTSFNVFSYATVYLEVAPEGSSFDAVAVEANRLQLTLHVMDYQTQQYKEVVEMNVDTSVPRAFQAFLDMLSEKYAMPRESLRMYLFKNYHTKRMDRVEFSDNSYFSFGAYGILPDSVVHIESYGGEEKDYDSAILKRFDEEKEKVVVRYNLPVKRKGPVRCDQRLSADKNETLLSVKLRMAQAIGLEEEEFKISVPSVWSSIGNNGCTELKEMDKTVVEAGLTSDSVVLVHYGAPTRPGHFKVCVVLCDLAAFNPRRPLFDILIDQHMIFGEVAKLISNKMMIQHQIDLPAEFMRFREMMGDEPGKPYSHLDTLATMCSPWDPSDGKTIAIQRSEVPNEELTPDDLILIVQRWHSSTWTLGDKFEMVVSSKTSSAEFALMLSQRLATVEAANIAAVKTWSYTPLDESRLAGQDWKCLTHPDVADATLAATPWYLSTGTTVLVRDTSEEVKELTAEEKKQLKDKSNPQADFSMFSFGSFEAKESGVKIKTKSIHNKGTPGLERKESSASVTSDAISPATDSTDSTDNTINAHSTATNSKDNQDDTAVATNETEAALSN